MWLVEARFAVSDFAPVLVGVVRLLQMDRQTLSRALLISLVSTGLLFVIELAFSGGFPQGVPWGVFVFLAAMSFVAASSLIQGLGRKSKNSFVRFGSVLVGLFAIAAWTTLFVDQLPCSLGGRGC